MLGLNFEILGRVADRALRDEAGTDNATKAPEFWPACAADGRGGMGWLGAGGAVGPLTGIRGRVAWDEAGRAVIEMIAEIPMEATTKRFLFSTIWKCGRCAAS